MTGNKSSSPVIHLRPKHTEDEAFLAALFCACRETEFGLLPEIQRESLLRLQYEAQSRGYAKQFPHSEDFIIEFDGKAAGRLLLNRGANELRVVDIAVVPELRGQGIASAVLRSLNSEAREAGVPLTLSVWRDNPALALYRRLGFRVQAESATHLQLEWRSAS